MQLCSSERYFCPEAKQCIHVFNICQYVAVKICVHSCLTTFVGGLMPQG